MHALTGQIRRARVHLATELECLTAEQRCVAMHDACIDHCGNFTPIGGTSWGPHFADVSCLGVYGSGETEDEAIRHWIVAVHRIEAAAKLDAVA